MKQRRRYEAKISTRDLVPLIGMGLLAFYFIRSFQRTSPTSTAQPSGPGYDSGGGPAYG